MFVTIIQSEQYHKFHIPLPSQKKRTILEQVRQMKTEFNPLYYVRGNLTIHSLL